MTPHVSGVGDIPDLVEDVIENFKRFKNGEPLIYQIDFKSGY